MHVTHNTLGHGAEATTWTDLDGRLWCVLVVKGRYRVGEGGELRQESIEDPAEVFTYADEYWGEPAASSLRLENDFAPFKLQTDVVVIGHAHAPGGRALQACEVALVVGGQRKILRVHGPRVWTPGLAGVVPSAAQPFVRVPLRWEGAYGGSAEGHCEWRNPVGRGLTRGRSDLAVVGEPAPTQEYIDEPVTRWGSRVRPASLGPIARGWQPRLGHAGTYDAAWKADRFPFLPLDFDPLHFQMAPEDQRFPALAPGTEIACVNLDPTGMLRFRVPPPPPPARFRFRDRVDARALTLDTVVIEPDERRVSLCWRARVDPGPKLTALRGIELGEEVGPDGLPRKRGKPYFRSLAEYVRWAKARRRGGGS